MEPYAGREVSVGDVGGIVLGFSCGCITVGRISTVGILSGVLGGVSGGAEGCVFIMSVFAFGVIT